MKILLACEYSGRVREALRARGHDVTSCDLLPSEDNSPHHVVGDVIPLAYSGRFDMMIAHPPCTYLANSGVRWLYDKNGNYDHERWRNLRDGAVFFAQLLRAPIAKIAVENPVMHKHGRAMIGQLLTSGQMPDTHFTQPWHHGDPAFKATGFTLKGLMPLVPTNKLVPPKKGTDEHKKWSEVHRMSPGPDRWKNRSRTYPGIARAIAEQWG